MRNRAWAVLAVMTSGLLAGTALTAAGAAAASSGSLDPTFGSGGISVTGSGFNGVAKNATLLPSGDIIVSGDFGVARFRPNGALDTTFGSSGFADTGFADGGVGGGGLAVQPDGKIIWAGDTSAANLSPAFAIARFTPNGTLDASFGRGGQVTTQFFAPPLPGAQQTADAVVVQPDGKILVGGSARQGQNRFAPTQGALVRLNPDGSPDPGFGTSGQVLTIGGGIGNITALGLDTAGDIFGLPAHAEFTSSGHLDATVTPAAITASSHGSADAFLPAGQYVHTTAAGVARHDVDVQVQRFNADGSLASAGSAFDYSGATGLDQARDSASAVAIQANGQAVIGGSHFLATSPPGLARVSADGRLDAGFGSGGVLTTNIPGGFGFSAVLIQPDGKIIGIGAGQDNSTGHTEVIMARYIG
jgi:uncharacterized delta-60 repeat protein